MKVLLVVPPSEKRMNSSVSVELDKNREFRQFLGILYIAATAELVDGVEVQFIDCDSAGIDYDALPGFIKKANPDLLGVSVLTFTLIDSLKVADLTKSILPNVKVCLGGIHVTYYPMETLSHDSIDYVITGEGEVSFSKLLDALKGIGNFNEIAGLGYKADGKLYYNGPQTDLVDLSKVARPAHHMTDLEKYTHILGEGEVVGAIQATRGCPFSCLFCDIRKTKFRYRNIEDIIDEIKYLQSNGVTQLFFVDDTITVNQKWLVELCERMIDEKLNLSFKISSRVNTITEELLVFLKKAGCKRIHFGVETGVQRLLDYLEKGIQVEQTIEAFRLCRKVGIQTFAYAMIGIPTETREEMEITAKFIESLNASYVSYSVCTPYPNTALYNQMLDSQIVEYDYWQEFAKNPDPEFHVPEWNKSFRAEELREIQKEFQSRFYSRPKFLFNELWQTRSLSSLFNKLKLGFKILTPTWKR